VLSFTRCLSVLLLTVAFAMPIGMPALPAIAAHEAESPFSLARLKRLESEIERYRSLRSDWPGYDLLAYTLVFADSQGTAYLLNAAPTGSQLSKESQAVPGLKRIRRIDREAFTRLELVSEHTYDTKTLGDETIYLVAPLPHPDPLHEFLTLLHEVFHDYQVANLAIPFSNGNELYVSADDYAYTQVEAHLLARLSGETNSGRLRQGLTLYRAVRALHAGILSKKPTAYRQGMDIMEGTAQYLTDKYYQKARPDNEGNRIALTGAKLRARLLEPQLADRDRYYHMGAALAHLLDRIVPDWKTRFVPPSASFDSILAEHLGKADSPHEVLRSLGPSYSLQSRLSTAQAAFESMAKSAANELEEALKRHRDGGSTRLRIIFSARSGLSMGGSWVVYRDMPNGERLTEAKLYEVKKDGAVEPLVRYTGTAVTRSMGDTFDLDFQRAITPGDLLIGGQAFVPAAHPQRGTLRLDRAGVQLKIRLAEVEQESDGTLTIRVVEP
jgi:hypothetical protein